MAKDGGGKGEIAYFTDSAPVNCEGMVPGIYLRTWYDCDGKPFGPWREWDCRQGGEGNWENIPIRGYGLLGTVGRTTKGIMTDTRTPKMMAAACCPPELMTEFLRKEGEAGLGPDAAEEAAMLHKRGYLGGGG